jgi:predicted DNA-binding protein (UPF0251 family)
MIVRCTDSEHDSFKNYGARGITFDPSWLDFTNFLSDMGERPEGYTLDRINPDGNYCKKNCRWVDAATQQHNRRDAKLNWPKIERIQWMHAEGFTQTQIAKHFGVRQSTISRVLSGLRWKAEKPIIKKVEG